MKRFLGMSPSWWVFAVVMIALTVILITVFYHWDINNKKECRDKGGQVLQVHGGRGGWVCSLKESE